jgi:hypothetical protein
MPVHEIERHPFLQYYQNIPSFRSQAYKGIIFGFFPVFVCTDTIDENLAIV